MKQSELRQIIKEEISKVLKESFSNRDSYKNVTGILKDLHTFFDEIKFRTEWVNGYYNIVYDDPNNITKHLLTKLKDSKFWNTEFAPSTGKFANGRVNIVFSKYAQKILNIEDFDQKDWSPIAATHVFQS